MTGIFVSRAPLGMSRCARCHRYFKPRKEGDRFGPRCAAKEAASIAALKRYGSNPETVIV